MKNIFSKRNLPFTTLGVVILLIIVLMLVGSKRKSHNYDKYIDYETKGVQMDASSDSDTFVAEDSTEEDTDVDTNEDEEINNTDNDEDSDTEEDSDITEEDSDTTEEDSDTDNTTEEDNSTSQTGEDLGLTSDYSYCTAKTDCSKPNSVEYWNKWTGNNYEDIYYYSTKDSRFNGVLVGLLSGHIAGCPAVSENFIDRYKNAFFPNVKSVKILNLDYNKCKSVAKVTFENGNEKSYDVSWFLDNNEIIIDMLVKERG